MKKRCVAPQRTSTSPTFRSERLSITFATSAPWRRADRCGAICPPACPAHGRLRVSRASPQSRAPTSTPNHLTASSLRQSRCSTAATRPATAHRRRSTGLRRHHRGGDISFDRVGAKPAGRISGVWRTIPPAGGVTADGLATGFVLGVADRSDAGAPPGINRAIGVRSFARPRKRGCRPPRLLPRSGSASALR